MKQLLTSKKFLATLVGCASVVATTYFSLPEESVDEIVKLLMAYVVGQGMADFGKHAK